jgi:hypothetical protein
LPFECVELAGAVASVDDQLLVPVYESDGPDLGLAASALGVDDRDPARADRDVVDVRAAASWDSSVVEHDNIAPPQMPVERPCCRRLAFGALLPRVHVVRFASERGDKSPDRPVAFAQPTATRE